MCFEDLQAAPEQDSEGKTTTGKREKMVGTGMKVTTNMLILCLAQHALAWSPSLGRCFGYLVFTCKYRFCARTLFSRCW